MFSFIKKYAASLNGVEVYPKIGIVLFLLVFAGMLWFALKADKNYIHELEQIPLDEKDKI
ncbi:MAG: CcoQ/FixQ family Cbb3-type cytochrome c oxidase assembly chaperone [Chitinophagales bacterium]